MTAQAVAYLITLGGSFGFGMGLFLVFMGHVLSDIFNTLKKVVG